MVMRQGMSPYRKEKKKTTTVAPCPLILNVFLPPSGLLFPLSGLLFPLSGLLFLLSGLLLPLWTAFSPLSLLSLALPSLA